MAVNASVKDIETITVDGKEIELINKKVDIFSIEFYPENPRIHHIISGLKQPVIQNEIENKIWEISPVHDLFQDIKHNGGLTEPILISKNLVVEGNCRLCCYRQLYKKASEAEKKLWREIPAKILPADITEDQICVLLGIYHIKEKIKWDPYEKASYIWRTTIRLNKPIEKAMELFNIKKYDAERCISVYLLMEGHNIADIKTYSYFDEYFKSDKLKAIAKNDPTLEDDVVKWVTEGRVPGATEMRDLGDILSDQKIGPKFRSGILDFDEALEETKERHPDLESSFYKHLKKSQKWLENARILEIKEEITKDKHKLAIVKYFLKAARNFEKSLNIDEQEDPRDKKKKRRK